jgi:molybdate transport system ATP-binding protein
MIKLSVHKVLQDAEGDMPLSLDLSIKEGSFVSFFGPSGSGKTSILRMIAGLLTPDSGSIEIEGISWYNSETRQNMKVKDRSVGYLFQEYVLFPNMTVIQNLHYALKKGQDESQVEDLVRLTGLGKLVNRLPETLSGGQKQRVALARALVQQPRALLLDEPLSALDMKSRRQLQSLILDIHQKLNITIILVSHDISEVIRMSERVYKLERGRVIEEGTPLDLFAQPGGGSKFQVVGSLIDKYQQDFVFILTILIGKQVVRLVVSDDEGADLEVGDTVQIVSKAFNPIVSKIEV